MALIHPAKHIAHEHLFSVVNTELKRFPPNSQVHILDVGCGNGELIAYFQEHLLKLNQGLYIELYGFDVYDHGVQKVGFLQQAIEHLSLRFPDIPWKERISSLTTATSWPYSNGFFQVVISNQVLEHVGNHCFFFANLTHILSENGFSVHLFPLKHYIYEGHLHLPFVHRIMNYDLLMNYIKYLSILGVGKFRGHKKTGISLGLYSESHADYIHYFTNYISYQQALMLGKEHGLRTSYRYTREFYIRKLRSLVKVDNSYEYKQHRSFFYDWISVMILKYVSCITLFLEKTNIFP